MTYEPVFTNDYFLNKAKEMRALGADMIKMCIRDRFPTPQNPPNWSTRIDIPTVAQISPNSRVLVYPSNSRTGASGPVVLEGIVNSTTC